MRVFLPDHLADRRPEMAARALLAERQCAETATGGDLTQELLAQRKTLCRGDDLRGTDVHEIDHRRRGALPGEELRDFREGAGSLTQPAEGRRHGQAQE